MMEFLNNHTKKLLVLFYLMIIIIVGCLVFASISHAMFSVKNQTDENEYRKYPPKGSVNPNYELISTYISSFKFRVTVQQGNEDPKWMDDFGRNLPKIELPAMDTTSSPFLIEAPFLYTKYITAYVTGVARTQIVEETSLYNPCYVGFSEVCIPESRDIKRVRLIFNGLNDNFEPMIDFEVNEKHNILNQTKAVSFISHCKPFKDVILK